MSQPNRFVDNFDAADYEEFIDNELNLSSLDDELNVSQEAPLDDELNFPQNAPPPNDRYRLVSDLGSLDNSHLGIQPPPLNRFRLVVNTETTVEEQEEILRQERELNIADEQERENPIRWILPPEPLNYEPRLITPSDIEPPPQYQIEDPSIPELPTYESIYGPDVNNQEMVDVSSYQIEEDVQENIEEEIQDEEEVDEQTEPQNNENQVEDNQEPPNDSDVQPDDVPESLEIDNIPESLEMDLVASASSNNEDGVQVGDLGPTAFTQPPIISFAEKHDAMMTMYNVAMQPVFMHCLNTETRFSCASNVVGHEYFNVCIELRSDPHVYHYLPIV